MGSADRSMSTNTIEIAPLANCNELNEKYDESVQQIPTRSLPTPPFQSPNQDDSESGSSFVTAIGTPAFTRSEVNLAAFE
ncbi:unnamed protein product [Anisakis simplex]|uniref:Uncharacterized protein n=1 Tax=Anisakis simplex TaxID=6269 RepID=A0A3P6NNY5_ANISI|nr:unnamed protein product [Anisakis simplex]